jgi:hypothetical protein
MVTSASPTIILIISVVKPRLETFKQADNHRGKLLGVKVTKSVLPVITDKYKNADVEKEIKEIIGDLRKELSNLSQEIIGKKGHQDKHTESTS